MLINERHYPHPVLSDFSDDFVDSKFASTVEVEPLNHDYLFKVNFFTDNSNLCDLIMVEKAHYAIHIECRSTGFRQLIKSKNNILEFRVNADRLNGRVEVNSLIVAANDLIQYKNDKFHPDYDDISFKVMKGDVLAVGEGFKFNAEKNIDPLRKIPSIFYVALKRGANIPPFDVRPDDHRITIEMSEEAFNNYQSLADSNQELHRVLCSFVVVPALIWLLEQIVKLDGDVEEYEDLRWFSVLSNRLKEFGFDVLDPEACNESTLVLAQKLVGDPLVGALKVIEDLVSEN